MSGSVWKEMSGVKEVDDVWLYIFSYLSYQDLISFSNVNTYFNRLSNHNFLWRELCKKHWLEEECPKDLTWKQHFGNWFRDFGRYIHCYRQIKSSWDKLYKFVETNCPGICQSIKCGASESELDAAEEKLYYKLPLDMRCSYRIHNGQSLSTHGLLGSVKFYNYYRSETLLDIETACEHVQSGRGPVGCMPLTICLYSGFSEYISLTDQHGLAFNHIYCRSRDDVTRFRSGSDLSFFISGKSFLSWFSSYVEALTSGCFSLNNGQIFRFYHEPECVERTGPFVVSVSTCFLPDISRINPPSYLHAYRITMQMDEDGLDSDSCQLETRHWILTDENGQEDRVDGPGVVGEYPTMRPGESFTWTSWLNFKTTYGNMRGHFKMRNLKTGMLVSINCPVFHMKCLPYIDVFVKKDL